MRWKILGPIPVQPYHSVPEEAEMLRSNLYQGSLCQLGEERTLSFSSVDISTLIEGDHTLSEHDSVHLQLWLR